MAARLKKNRSKHSSLGAIPRRLCLRVCGRREVTRKRGLGDVYKRAHEDMHIHAENFFFFLAKASQIVKFFSNIGITGIKQSYLCIYDFS